MPASVRDILLVIKTKEDAQRAMNNISGAMRRAAAQADAASARARAAALRAQAVQAKTNGATVAQVRALQAAARAEDQRAKSIDRSITKQNHLREAITGVGSTMQTTGLAIAVAGAGMAYGLKAAVDTAVAWDKQVRLTYTQVDKRFKPSLRELSDIGLRVSRDIATPFEGIQDALFDVFSSTEANLPQAEALLRSFAQAAVAGNTDIQTASRATIGLMNAYQIPFKDVNKILDVQFQLVQEGVGTYEEWAQRIGLVTPSAVRAGQSIETMAAALATSTRQGISAARSGTAVARAFDAMSNPKTEKKLKALGVATRDAKGNFRPLVDVLTEWREQLEKMPKEDRVKSILDVLKGAGSTIEARRFLQGILLTKGGLELFQDQIKEFATDKGAFQNAYREMSNSVSAKSQLLHNKWMQLKQTIGEALLPTFGRLLDKLDQLVSWFNNLPPKVKETIAQVALWGAALSIVAGVLTLILGAIIMFAAGLATLGTAALPFLAVLGLVAAAVTLLILGLIGLGIAFYNAWNDSKNFRDLLLSVKLTAQDAWNIFKGFWNDMWKNFQEKVVPSLKNLRDAIEDDVLPAVQGFVAWWRTNMNPIFDETGRIINENLKPAFEDFSNFIDNTLVPALKDAKTWWDKNKDAILPVIKFLGIALAMGIIFAAWLQTGLVRSLILGWQQFMVFARIIKTLVVGAWKILAFQGWLVVAVVKAIWNWFKNLGKGASDGATKAKNAMQGVKNFIMNLFSGAGAWLVNAGRNIVAGLANGIRGGAGAVAAAAKGVAQNAIAAAKAALAIKSPSRVFKDIGKDVIRGFTEGVKNATTQKQLMNAIYKVSRDVIRSINAADIKKSTKDKMRNKWNKRLATTTKKLTDLERRRESVQKRLKAAQASVNDQIKKRDELSTKIRDAVAASADIDSLSEEQKQSPQWMLRGLNERLVAVKQFQANLRSLAKKGLDKETIADLASQGVDQAGALVAKLNTASSGELKAISKVQAEIRKVAGETGKNVSGDLYNQGIKAGQGLVKGLQSQLKTITAEMTKIAAALVKAIKKELGIKSPSRVFQELGVNTAQGYVNGYMKRMGKNMNDMTAVTAFKPTAPQSRVGFGSQQASVVNPGLTRHFEQNITIHTQEIDPRKNAAELGWLLESRVS